MLPNITDHQIALVSLFASIGATIVSIIAFVYTAKTFWLKAGAYIRGSFTICSSVSCEDKYISSVTLENLKDRAIVIFKIYLRLGHSYFVEIEDFENNPLVLRPFEAFRKDYDPLDFYSVSMTKININALLSNDKIKRRLVLVTTDGKYVVRHSIKYWDPVYDFFKNHLTAVIQPMRSTYKGKAYGGNAKFLVEFKMENGKEEVIPIFPLDYKIKRFKRFDLTKESLESQASLEEFLYDRVGEGTLKCVDVVVHELEGWRKEAYERHNNKEVIEASYESWFTYYVLGRIYTIFSDYRLRRKNKATKQLRNSNPNDTPQ
ncbi:MAG: hypothetical protein ABSH21_13040 [Verrucomicrobiia bacterium]|jgi:hypothetical protein